MDLLVIVLAAAIGTALGGGLALLAQRKGRGSGVEAELHIVRERLKSSEMSLEAAHVTLADAQKTADDRLRQLERQTSDFKTVLAKAQSMEQELEKHVERRQAAERRVDELIMEREHGLMPPPLEGSTDLLNLREQLEAEIRKSQSLEAELVRRDEDRCSVPPVAMEPVEVEQLKAELQSERDKVRQLLSEIGDMLSQTSEAGAAAALETARAQAADELARLNADVAHLSTELAEQNRLREEDGAKLALAGAAEAAHVQRFTEEIARLTDALAAKQQSLESESTQAAAEIARLTAELAEVRQSQENESTRVQQVAAESQAIREQQAAGEIARLTAELAALKESQEAEAARAQQASAEVARLAATIVQQQQVQELEAARTQQAEQEIARLTAELAAQKQSYETESVRAHQMAGDIFRLQEQIAQSQLSEADKVQRLSDEVTRLSALAIDERKRREDASSEREAVEAQLREERAVTAQERQLREQEGLQRLALEERSQADQLRIAQLETEYRQQIEQRIAAFQADIDQEKHSREEVSAQLAQLAGQLSGERDRVTALETERAHLLDRVEEERRASAKSRELLNLAQDRMASVFAVFSGETPKANGHHVTLTAEAPNGAAKPDSESVSVA